MSAGLPPAFWANVDKTDTCWVWTSNINSSGYGEFYAARNTTRLAHRLSWIDTNGSVPDGLELDHLCENKPCVRPDHLEAVTHQENMRRHYANRDLCRTGLHPKTPENRIVRGGKERCHPCELVNNKEAHRRYRASKTPPMLPVASEVRAWAKANGHQVTDNGTIPNRVLSAYLVAMAETAA